MECDCSRVGILNKHPYSDACKDLVHTGQDCTIIDAGCGTDLHLFAMKRHLSHHGIKCHTIGIDDVESDIIVDEFCLSMIQDAKFPNVADVVISSGVAPIYPHKDDFQKLFTSMSEFLKQDGKMFVTINKCEKSFFWPPYGVKIMTKQETIRHGEECFGRCIKKCPHGIISPYDDSINGTAFTNLVLSYTNMVNEFGALVYNPRRIHLLRRRLRL